MTRVLDPMKSLSNFFLHLHIGADHSFACVRAELGIRHSMYHRQDLDTYLLFPFFCIELA